MAIKDLVNILAQVHEPDEYKLVAHDLEHPTYYIWKLDNVKMKGVKLFLRPFRKEHARFDIFINGQYVLEKDYITEHSGNTFFIKFFKENFPYNVIASDDIKLEGDLDTI